MSNGACVKHVKRGQSLTLCISHTTTPPEIPHGKHVISVSRSFWSRLNETGRRFRLYTCSNGSCTQYKNVNITRYSPSSNTCLTINNVQENEEYFFDALATKFGFVSILFRISLEGMLACVWNGVYFISVQCRGCVLMSLYDVILR